MYGRLVEVVVDVEAPGLPQPLTYRVAGPGEEKARVGACVLVPLANRQQIGFLVATEGVTPPADHAVRDVVALLDAEPFFDARAYALIKWMSRRWRCGIVDALRCIVPAAVSAQVQRVVRLTGAEPTAKLSPLQTAVRNALMAAGGCLPHKELLHLSSLSKGPTPNSTPRGIAAAVSALRAAGLVEDTYVVQPPRVRPRLQKAVRIPLGADAARLILQASTERQAKVLRHLARAGEPIPCTELIRTLGVSAGVLSALEKRGLAESCTVRVTRDPFRGPSVAAERHRLTDDQRAALAPILASLARSAPGRFLIHGVTASGKTEVYLRAIEEAVEAGNQAIFLVPEISLTAQMLDLVKSRFGRGAAVLHSRLSEGERYDEWCRIRRGEVAVVVGARSAVFAPLERLRLIVMDEEHDGSYKQETAPRYHTRDVAVQRAATSGASLVLGSATPSVETFYWAGRGSIQLLNMPRRIDDRPLPNVEVVDLRQAPPTIFSPRLHSAIQERLAKGQQTILFLNRRGFSTFVLCRDCGYTARCPNCSVTLTYHASTRQLRCHHCDYSRRAVTTCPSCSGTRIRHFGLGTEKVEAETCRAFPNARVLRMDRDTTGRKDAHRALLRRFRDREADILIGTQMVAKGLDFPGVTLVGVVAADTALNLPDFRAAERSFQILAQVSGRAGRGDDPGEVVIQTFNPEHYSLQAAAKHDYLGFYQREIAFRKELSYPPFSRLANVVVADTSNQAAESRVRAVAAALTAVAQSADLGVQILGPAPAPLERIKGRYRWHVVVKARNPKALGICLDGLETLAEAARAGLVVDVDPMSLL